MSVYDTVVPHPKFAVGDRVRRLRDVMDETSEMMTGTVAVRYRAPGAGFAELYAVRWDHGVTDEGYLPHGLDAG